MMKPMNVFLLEPLTKAMHNAGHRGKLRFLLREIWLKRVESEKLQYWKF